MVVLVLKYVVIALLLAYLNRVFSKKKAVMTDVKKHILEKRLTIYAAIHKALQGNKSIIAPPAMKELYYWNFIEGMPFRIGDQRMEYVSYFNSYDTLIGYFAILQKTGFSKATLLPKDVAESLEMVRDWYGSVIDILTAFKLTEEDTAISVDQRKEHLDLACQLFGIALQSDICAIGGYLEKSLVDRLHYPSLLNLFKVSVINKIRMKWFRNKYKRLDLCCNASFLVVLLTFVNVSDKYSRDEFEKLPDDQRRLIQKQFHTSFVKHLPHG